MSSKKVFSQLAARTHMPFYNDGTIVFCMNDVPAKLRTKIGLTEQESDYRPWQIFRADWATKSIAPVRTAMPENAVLCNPMFFKESNMLHVSFIAGIPNETGIPYRLYAMHGASWETLCDPTLVNEQFAWTGFVSPRHFCLGSERLINLLDRIDHKRYRLTTSLSSIARVTFDPQQPSRLLITGAKEEQYKTLLFDIDANTIHEIVGPAPVYKACLIGNRVVYSYRESEEIEDFQLHVAPLELQSSNEIVTVLSV
jgi:hypothetical protein